MDIWRAAARATVVGSIGIAALIAQPVAASADCVYAEFYVTRQDAPPVWVVGENDPCLTETPWSWGLLLPGDVTKSGLPSGSPNGYHRDIRIPLPV